MYSLHIVAVASIVVEAGGLGIGMLLIGTLFAALEKKYPKYYTLIGKPKVAASASTDYSQPFKAQLYVLLLMLRGLPSNFPKDHNLQKSARLIRFLFIGLFINFPIAVGLAFTVFK